MQLPARLTLTEAAATLAQLQQTIERVAPDEAIEVDASTLGDFDTSAIAVLLEARRTAIARRVAFRLRAPPPKLGQLAELYGVHDLLDLRPVARMG